MLPRQKRVTTSLFPSVLKGRISHSAVFSLRVAPSDGKITRFSVVVPKKVLAKATDRNKLKRRTLAIIKTLYPTIKKPVLAVFFAKKGADALTSKQIETEIKTLLAQARVSG
jgi:ribonuclease P protein component